MGMNLFFRAFTQAQIDQMAADHNVIDKLVEDRQYAFEGCIDTAWDVLRCVLDGAGTSAGDFVDDALFNGCFLISADEVRQEAQTLSNWTHDGVLQGLQNVQDDAYHLEVYQDEPGGLLEHFDALVAFYRDAAAKGLAAISYHA